jgi:hypothetical protein
MKQLLLSMRTPLFRSRASVRQKPMPSLAFCVLMDALGCASYALPFLGEIFDLVWAPISAAIYFRTFGGVKGAFGGAFNFIEELMPGMDIIPTFTITWFLENKRRKKQNTIYM